MTTFSVPGLVAQLTGSLEPPRVLIVNQRKAGLAFATSAARARKTPHPAALTLAWIAPWRSGIDECRVGPDAQTDRRFAGTPDFAQVRSLLRAIAVCVRLHNNRSSHHQFHWTEALDPTADFPLIAGATVSSRIPLSARPGSHDRIGNLSDAAAPGQVAVAEISGICSQSTSIR